jgi:ribosomal protein S18 acetylase RimI-like enzyme
MKLGQIEIRRATVRDAAAIAAVHDEAWRLAYRGVIPGAQLEQMVERRGPAWWLKAVRRQANILVLEVGGRVAGYATVGPTRMRALPFTGEIYELYVKPEYQGLGFGSHLFTAARQELARFGLTSFAVRVLADNAPARDFYARRGGQAIAETSERLGETVMAVAVLGWSE